MALLFKQGGIQNQSSRVIDLIVESAVDYIDSICTICSFVLKEYLIERSMSVHAEKENRLKEHQKGRYYN